MDSNTNMVNHNFTITKGDSLQFTITIEDTQVEPSDIIFTVKDESFDGEDVIHYSLLHGEINRKQEEGYVYSIYIPYYTSEKFKLLNYIYQIELVFGGDHETVAEGKLIVTPEL